MLHEKVLGIYLTENKNYSSIKKACKKKDLRLYELCHIIGISRQHLHKQVNDGTLKEKYIEKLEKELNIKYD